MCSAAELDRAEFAMQRKLARQQTMIASEEGERTPPALRRFSKSPGLKVLDDSRITALHVDVGDDSPVIMEGRLKKRIVTRTVLWAERYARRAFTLAHTHTHTRERERARARERERKRETQ